MNTEELFTRQRQTILDGDAVEAAELARAAVEAGVDLNLCIDSGYVAAIQEVGQLFEEGELFLPELMQGADAMKAAMDILRPELLRRSAETTEGPKVVIGTVQGDIHDIGKTLVATMLEANGFTVIDLGRDVKLAEFIDRAVTEQAPLIALSALLTTTMPGHGQVIALRNERGLDAEISVMVGGAPVTRSFAEEIGADGYAPNAMAAVKEARRLTGFGL